jgi:hypothetical protein
MGKRALWRVLFARRARDAHEMKLRALVSVAIYLVLAVALVAFGGDFRNEGLVLLAVQAPIVIGVGLLRDRGHFASREVPGGAPDAGLWNIGSRYDDRM